jgi:hypothetical protein
MKKLLKLPPEFYGAMLAALNMSAALITQSWFEVGAWVCCLLWIAVAWSRKHE